MTAAADFRDGSVDGDRIGAQSPGAVVPASGPLESPALPRPGLSGPGAELRLPLRKRLSYKQARNTALLTLVLGLILSTVQIVVDLFQLERKTDALIHQVVSTLQEPAAEACYVFDKALATRVLDGLLQYRPIHAAVILDDFGNRLASNERPPSQGSLKWLTEFLFPQEKHYTFPLVASHRNKAVGEMRVALDRHLVAQEFFERSGLVLLTGATWTLMLAGILVVMFYIAITKPFLRMARALSRIDPTQPTDQLIAIPKQHAGDELGLLARTINGLLHQFQQSLVRRQHAEDQLREREARLRGIMENVADGIITLDHAYRIESMNRAALDLFRCDMDAARGQPLADLITRGDWKRVQAALTACLERKSDLSAGAAREELWGRRRTGDMVPLSFGASIMRLGDQVIFICVVQDIAQRKQAEVALRESEERLMLAVTATRSGVWDFNLLTGEYWWSQEFVGMLGYGEDELPARHGVWESLVHPDDLPWCKSLAERYLRGEVPDYQPVYRMRRKDGSWVWIEDKAHAVRDDDGSAIRFTGTMSDVTERKRFEEQLMYMATRDPLTGLPNRTLLQDRLSHAMTMANRKGHTVGVLFLDLDRFKVINDSLGHNIGDELLRQVGQLLIQAARPTDTVGRLGGDEFLIIVEELATPQDAGRIAKSVLSALAKPLSIDGHSLFITPSIGISIYSGDDTDVASLLRHADTAMYSAKSSGGNTYRYFIPEMNEEAVARLSLEHSLREAIEKDQFLVYYQPKVDLVTLRPVGLEALIRWRHPEMGMVPPVKFIPLAEEMGMIIPIGDWVLRSALQQIRSWIDRGIEPLPISVNMSVRQLTSGSPVQGVQDMLAESGVDPEWLELEITETMMMDNMVAIVETLRELRGLGLKIAIDDFGTGYSSLSYLRRLPITALKVDRSFINDVTTNADDAAIAATIIAMGHQLGLKIIAEGIETDEQLAFLRRHQCDEMQGFLVSRPIPPDELESRFLRAGHWAPDPATVKTPEVLV